ncbi:MAG: UDP-N-acetylmuramoyl-L-alanine--D-glutamate ligase [Bdellovibrionaceae bacterium]|nr:UDP-N-acetylmuramoyl-L-alanine--D-glutamate ligase [Pseudobdellovibrionaceae bacterium]MDW8190115.1 UDP-N-acetylmuramoyl-L-alanine--D-glutamate ligase [Pseudobdellovibrionaceae bacterium]
MFQDVSELKDKKILVVGLGKTGLSLSHFLVSHGAQVTVTDHKSRAELSEQLEQLGDLPVTLELGGHTPKTFLKQDLVILSPGISTYLKIFEYCRAQGIKVVGELEFASWFIKEPILAVTGTNGKTTTVKIIEAMLRESGKKVWAGGSFGIPVTDYLRSGEKADVVVIEATCFQLETCEHFTPATIVFTSLAENHLDRYRSMEDYVNAKRKIFRNVNLSTTSILNADDNAVVELARDPVVQRGKLFYYSRKQILEPQIMNIGGCVNIGKTICARTTGPEKDYYDLSGMKLKGRHNIENIMAAILAVREHGATHEAIQKVIQTFAPLPHRIEYVRRVGGVYFYNDSLCTNVHALSRALELFPDNVILIAGGKDARLSFEGLRPLVKRKVKSLLLYGEAKEQINRDIGDFTETYLIGTFEEAVLIAYQKSRIDDFVLLSPGCPASDLFDSAEERGEYFKQMVKKFR